MPAPVTQALYDQLARGWRSYVLVALIALASSLFGAARMPAMDRDEAQFAQTTRQMVESHGAVRAEDAIGAHWLQAGAVRLLEPLTERTNAIWPYRLPSALGIVLAALATLWGGAALLGERPAMLGAGLFAAGMLAGFEGMSATAEALALGCTTLAMAALARLRSPGNSKVEALIFWLAVGAGVLVKGPITLGVAALALITLAAWERRAAWMAALLWWPGPLLGLAIAAPSLMGLADLTTSFAPTPSGHLALPGYHLALLSLVIFPATYALPGAVRLLWGVFRGHEGDAERDSLRFLLAWAAPIFLVLEVLPTKLIHYALPAYPAVALLCGAAIAATLHRRSRGAHPAGVVLFGVAGFVIVALMSLGVTFMPGDAFADLRRAISAGLVGVILVGGAIAGLIVLRRPVARTAVLIACALALSYSLRSHILPEARALHVSAEAMAALTRARLLPTEERPLWVVGFREPSIAFQTRRPPRVATAREAGRGAQVGDGLIVEGRELPATAAELAVRHLVFTQAEAPVHGLNLGDGVRVTLFVGTVEAASGSPAGGPPRNP